MKRTTNLLPAALSCLIFLIAIPADSNAQVWKNLGKKLEEKIENQASRRAERKIDQAIDKGFDKIEGTADDAVKGGKSNPGQNRLETIMGAMGAEVSLQDTYDFGIGVTYETTTKNGKGKAGEADMTMWFSDNPYVGMQSRDGNESVFTVLDSGQVILFMENQKSYMAIGSAMFEALGNAAGASMEQDAADQEDYTLTRLSDETILGHRCKVYQVKSSEAESRVWYTDELGVNMLEGFAQSLSTLTKQNLTQNIPAGMEASGLMLKMEARDLNSGDVVTMEAKSIHRDGKSIKSADYKRTGM